MKKSRIKELNNLKEALLPFIMELNFRTNEHQRLIGARDSINKVVEELLKQNKEVRNDPHYKGE